MPVKKDLYEIAAVGFDTVRFPIRWSAYADSEAPYTIDPNFYKKVDKVVRWATENNLNIIIDMHHYDELFIDPAGHSDRFVALWQQLAEHYKDQPDSVFFELINEPHNKLTNDIVEPLLTRTLAEVRKTNPTRKVIMGGAKAGAGLSRWRHLIRRKTPMSSPPSIFINHSTSPIRVQAGSIHRHQRQPASAVMKIMRGSTK